AVFLLVAVWSWTPAEAGTPCGSSLASQCNGACPEGQRCVPSFDTFSTLIVVSESTCQETEPLHQAASAANGGCECAEVRCGGEIENGMCMADGSCAAVAGAPAVSPRGLIAAITILSISGGLAVIRRRKTRIHRP